MVSWPGVWSDVDLTRQGKQVGFLNLEHSVTRSAYGIVPIPVAVIANGESPSVLLMAGGHGDEYEGQIVLSKLVRSIQPQDIKGRLIILPAANLPAALAGVRVSPLDAGNFNRAFPGSPVGGPTARIADIVATLLMPLCDVFVDLHSGGTSLNYLVHAYAELSGDETLDRRRRAALAAFNVPISVPVLVGGRKGLAAEVALDRRMISISGEFGGGGIVSAEGIRAAERGVHRLLAHLGMIALSEEWQPETETRVMRVDRSMYVYAPEAGVFEPTCKLGEEVISGGLAGYLHFPENPARPPISIRFQAGGLVVCLCAIGRVARGDCLGHLFADTAPGTPPV